ELFTTLQHVLNFWRIIARVVVRRNRWVLLQSLIGDWNALLIAEALEVFQGYLLHLVGRVAALEVVAQTVALNGKGQDDGWLAGALVFHDMVVGSVNFAVV